MSTTEVYKRIGKS